MQISADFVIVGAGIMGLAVARALKLRYPDQSICVIDAADNSISHASGRNSGVIHAGFYYPGDSLKATFTRQGNQMLKAFCAEYEIPINPCGKLVVAQSEHDLEGLQLLYERAKTNQVPASIVDEQAAQAICPGVKTFSKALWSPSTASVDPKQVTQTLASVVKALGVTVIYNCQFIQSVTSSSILTSQGIIHFGHLINCAGLYADKVAKNFGLSESYTMMPFRGVYLKLPHLDCSPKVHIYPVPDLRFPFLGVHLTCSADGGIKIGPTAMPAFWRQQYDGVAHFNWKEFFSILQLNTGMWCRNTHHYRELAILELRKRFKSNLFHSAKGLYDLKDDMKMAQWTSPGVRAQLYDHRTKQLVMDFVVEHGYTHTHVLNAVSPAFTCALPFSKYVVDIVEKAYAKRAISEN